MHPITALEPVFREYLANFLGDPRTWAVVNHLRDVHGVGPDEERPDVQKTYQVYVAVAEALPLHEGLIDAVSTAVGPWMAGQTLGSANNMFVTMIGHYVITGELITVSDFIEAEQHVPPAKRGRPRAAEMRLLKQERRKVNASDREIAEEWMERHPNEYSGQDYTDRLRKTLDRVKKQAI